MDAESRAMKWKQMDGQERYQLIEMVRKGQVPVTQICETFSVSRQTLYRAMERLDEISVQALQPQKAGRKGKSHQQQMLSELATEKNQLQKELLHWKTKYEIAKTFLDLERRYDRGQPLPGEPGEKKLLNRSQRQRSKPGKQQTTAANATPMHAGLGRAARMERANDSGTDGDDASKPGPLDRPAAASADSAQEARPAGGDTGRDEMEDT